MSLFYFFGGWTAHHPTPGAACIPRRRPLPAPAHPERLHSAGNRAGRARTRADHARHDTHDRTLDTLHRSALDTRQATPGRSRRRWGAGGRGVCPKLCRFGQGCWQHPAAQRTRKRQLSKPRHYPPARCMERPLQEANRQLHRPIRPTGNRWYDFNARPEAGCHPLLRACL